MKRNVTDALDVLENAVLGERNVRRRDAPNEEQFRLQRIENIFTPLAEAVAAKILNYLSLEQLNAIRTVSQLFREIIDRFRLVDRILFDGKVYALGDGHYGRLGDGRDDFHIVSRPRLADGPFNRNVTAISCGYMHTAFVSNGQVYAFGNGGYRRLGDGRDDDRDVLSPRLVDGPFNRNVTAISCGKYHNAFVSNGRVYAFGDGEYGKLGDGRDDDHNVSSPRLVGGFNQNVTAISCGTYHTAFVSNGQVYAFGYGEYGKLGDRRDDEHSVSSPRLVDGPFNQNVTAISCGNNHTVFVSNGKVYAFGDGSFGKLGDGRDDFHSVLRPRLVDGPFNRNVTAISCGEYHTAFLTQLPDDMPVIASEIPQCISCQMLSVSICDQCNEVYCLECFEEKHLHNLILE
jgi:alpha-tubulin suppressor-like RCC1 family protein